ncbi:heat-inducible transcription repressor HrcA [Kosmotoga arenicorallina S304]|uniref:Heat-inducible transcription repressor HrcA n=1 Tax=Kosmotoga arenicorallina S304 TaxID=1453497 RepID=A0A182C7B0_9BACT|nr:heat-inducible transcriptional repressor HrcA [Kosmotoga arenicorallina]OAA31421.1 heat-inducible transcription repressor HrcA [Kosmotoga arenicorallina S304]
MSPRNSGKEPILNDRQVKILYCIVKEYITYGKPVSSRQVLHRSNISCSSATIRNDMRKLEFLGYIFQPHTSAGRIPTDKGLRFYFNSIQKLASDYEDSSASISLRQAAFVADVEKILKVTAKALSKVTMAYAVIEKPKQEKLLVKHIAISPISQNYFGVTLVTDLGVTMNSTVYIGHNFTHYEDLQRRLNDAIRGKMIGEIKKGLKELKLLNDHWYNEEIEEMLYILQNIFESEEENRYVKYGLEYIVSSTALNWQDIVGLIKHTEDQGKLNNLISKFSHYDEKVIIGKELGIEELKNFSLFISGYQKFNERLGTIAVLGPKILPYEKIYTYLKYMSNRLSEVFSKR